MNKKRYIRPSKKSMEELAYERISEKLNEKPKKPLITRKGARKIGKAVLKGLEIKGSVKPIKRMPIGKVEYLQRKRLLGGD